MAVVLKIERWARTVALRLSWTEPGALPGQIVPQHVIAEADLAEGRELVRQITTHLDAIEHDTPAPASALAVGPAAQPAADLGRGRP